MKSSRKEKERKIQEMRIGYTEGAKEDVKQQNNLVWRHGLRTALWRYFFINSLQGAVSL